MALKSYCQTFKVSKALFAFYTMLRHLQTADGHHAPIVRLA